MKKKTNSFKNYRTVHFNPRVVLLMLLYLFSEKFVLAQTNPPLCGGVVSPPTNNLFSAASANNCSQSSVAYSTIYSRQSTYVPNVNDPVITIKITFHVINDNNGNGSWPNTPQGVADLNTIAGWLHNGNERYSNPRLATYVVPGFVSPYINDSRINYELTNIYFYNNTALNTSTNDNSIFSMISAIDPSRLDEGIPIIFNNGTLSGAAGYAGGPSSPFIHTFVVSPPMGLWFNSVHLRHEMGHCLGLYHTYQGGGDEVQFGFNCNHPNFLSDVFPINNPMCPSGTLPCNVCYEASPNTSNNLMGGGASEWMSPLQMGRRIMNMHLTNIRKFAKEMTSGYLNPWTITSNETWDFDTQLYKDVVVKPGAILTIKCKVAMANKGRIIVERGAKLILDGGEISSWCKSWQGFQVWGTSSIRQTIGTGGLSTAHGIVSIINQGTIKDAENAITTIKYDENGNWDWGGYMGGIIQCDGAKFINNVRAIQYLSYSNYDPTYSIRIDNIGYIRNSLFETNSLLKDPATPYPQVFVSMWDVRGVKYFGNTYQNLINPLPSIDKRGNAIFSIDASYSVDRYKVCSIFNPITGQCASYSVNNPSTFRNLQYGVYAQNGTAFTNINVNDNDFLNCNRSVYVGLTYNTVVTNNRIDVGDGQNSMQFLPYGIYLENSSAYTVSDNTIYTTKTSNYNQSLGTGICINGTNGLNNTIKRNYINMMGAGSTVIGNNQGTNPGDGLKYKCNQFGQGASGLNYEDLYMQYTSASGINGKIDKVQGSNLVGANNFFSRRSPASATLKTDYNDSPFASPGLANSITYYFNPIVGSLTQPLSYDASMATPIMLSGQYNPSMCTESSGGGDGGGSADAARKIVTNNIATINALLGKVDGGKTESLLNEVASSKNAGVTLKQLTASGSYISDEVLIAYLTKKQVPESEVKEVLLSNSPLTSVVLAEVRKSNLSSDLKTQVENAQTGESRLTVLQSSVADYNQQIGDVIGQVSNRFITSAPDSILYVLEADTRPYSSYRLLSAYIALGKLNEAQKLISEVKNSNGNDDFIALQEIVLTLKQQNKSIFEIQKSQSMQQTLMEIEKNQKGVASTGARALLGSVLQKKFQEYIALPSRASSNSNMTSLEETQKGQIKDLNGLFVTYPNPASEFLLIQKTNNFNYQEASVVLFDVLGKRIKSQKLNNAETQERLNIEDVSNGVYIVNFIIDGNVVQKSKLIIEK